MHKPAMTPDAFRHRGTAAPFRVAIGLALAAGAGALLWGVGTHSLSFTSETRMTVEDRVADLTAQLAQVKAATAKLRESQGDTSEELSHIRASLANSEIGLAALRTTTDENEARGRDTVAQIESNLAQLKDKTLRLRMAQDDTATELGSLRAPDRAHRGRQGRDRLDRQEPQASGSQEVGGAALRRGHYPPQESGLESVREAEIGTSRRFRCAASAPLLWVEQTY
jgi:hypothetical protein